MARVKIDLPEKFHFRTEFLINVSQLNYGNHLSNEQILILAHEARLRYFKSLGGDEFNFWGANLIQSDAAIEYKSEGHHADTISVYVAIEEMTRVAFDVLYLMQNESSGKLLAIAKTGIVCFDYKAKKVLDVPVPFRNLIDQAERISFPS